MAWCLLPVRTAHQRDMRRCDLRVKRLNEMSQRLSQNIDGVFLYCLDGECDFVKRHTGNARVEGSDDVCRSALRKSLAGELC